MANITCLSSQVAGCSLGGKGGEKGGGKYRGLSRQRRKNMDDGRWQDTGRSGEPSRFEAISVKLASHAVAKQPQSLAPPAQRASDGDARWQHRHYCARMRDGGASPDACLPVDKYSFPTSAKPWVFTATCSTWSKIYLSEHKKLRLLLNLIAFYSRNTFCSWPPCQLG